MKSAAGDGKAFTVGGVLGTPVPGATAAGRRWTCAVPERQCVRTLGPGKRGFLAMEEGAPVTARRGRNDNEEEGRQPFSLRHCYTLGIGAVRRANPQC